MTKRPASCHIDSHTLQQTQKKQTEEFNNQLDDRQITNSKLANLTTVGQSTKDSKSKKIKEDSNNQADKKNKDVKNKLADCNEEINSVQAIGKNQSADILNNYQGVGLFSNNERNKIQGVKEKSKQIKILNNPDSLTNQKQKINNFSDSNSEVKEEKSIFQNKSKALFNNSSSSLLPGNSLFSGQNLFSKTSLFNDPKLFSGVNTNSSIFGFNASESLFVRPSNSQNFKKTQIDLNNGGEEQGDSAQLQKGQIMEIDPTKSNFKYEYNNTYQVIQSVKASKYKKDSGNLIQKVIITILLDSEKSMYYFVVRLAATQIAIFNGLLIPKKSKIRIINGKTQNFEIVVFNFQEENHKKKLKNHRIKIIISSQEANEAKLFYQKLTQIIEVKSDASK